MHAGINNSLVTTALSRSGVLKLNCLIKLHSYWGFVDSEKRHFRIITTFQYSQHSNRPKKKTNPLSSTWQFADVLCLTGEMKLWPCASERWLCEIYLLRTDCDSFRDQSDRWNRNVALQPDSYNSKLKKKSPFTQSKITVCLCVFLFAFQYSWVYKFNFPSSGWDALCSSFPLTATPMNETQPFKFKLWISVWTGRGTEGGRDNCWATEDFSIASPNSF